MNSKRSLRASTDALRAPAALRCGFTLVEGLIALAVAGVLIVFGVAIATLSQRVATAEQVRTQLNQNLRAAVDLVGADVRVAGERMSPRSNLRLRAIEVRPGELIVRRNRLDTTLAMCDPGGIAAGSSQGDVTVAIDSGTPPPRCAVIDDDGDGLPDGMEAWKAYREQNGGSVRVYIYSAGGDGEFFAYDAEDLDALEIERGSGSWQNGYAYDDRPTLVALDESRYFVQGGELLLERNGDPASRLRLVPNIARFDVIVTLRDGSVLTRYDAASVQDWNEIISVELNVEGRVVVNGDPYQRTLSASFFPRNALSN